MASFAWVTYGIVLRTQIFVCVNSEPVWMQQSFVNLQLVDRCTESESFILAGCKGTTFVTLVNATV